MEFDFYANLKMEDELKNFAKVWLIVLTSLCYCYYIGKVTRKGFTRFIAILPIVILFLILPLNLYTLHFGGTTSFFIAWLANFKLLLFAFAKEPLSSSLSLGYFVAVASLPIKATTIKHINGHKHESPCLENLKKGQKSLANYALKILALAIVISSYSYRDQLPKYILYTVYCCHMYLMLELVLGIVASVARALLGVELEPQFDEPYLATSLQDFWGRRWNIVVTRIMRPTVYNPIISMFASIIGRHFARLLAVLLTFLVSGIMHEIIFYNLGRLKPTGEVTLFFVLHGVCLVLETMVKNLVGKWRLTRWISGPLTLGFVLLTVFWLFFPPYLRFYAHERFLVEVAGMMDVGKKVGHAFNITLVHVRN